MFLIEITKCDAIGKYISKIHRERNAFLAKRFKKLGIGSGQYLILLSLYQKDGIRQEELVIDVNMDKGTVAKAVKKLEQEGYVNRIRDEKDKRAYRIHITEKARRNEAEFLNILKEWEKFITEYLSNREVEDVLNILKKIHMNKN